MDNYCLKLKSYSTYFVLFFLFFFTAVLFTDAQVRIKADRWLEIDLYWFEQKNTEQSVNEFLDRFYPLFDGIDGWKGIILNVGWISDYLLEWHGDLNETIRLPKSMKKWPWFKDEGQFTGTSAERIQLWEERFRKADQYQVINYEPWTYADLKKLTNLIKTTAYKKYKLMDLKVGSLVLGWENIYEGDKSVFAETHPNAYRNNAPNLVARLSADNKKYGAYPAGLPEGTPFSEFFGKQWGSLSKAVNLDVIVLRDSYLGVGVYARTGPYGKIAPSDPGLVKSWSDATADLVRQTKISNPRALVIGYSNAASAIADWRINCFDLETIAREGYLDGWIDQTWAGAWNEVGQRPQGFWNNQLLGWTYQLSYMLGRAALLADSKVHHYFLTETFDAWESWDIIHNARERLRWGIWAFSHAAVKKSEGLKMPDGSYISWCNQGKKLLSAQDIKFLAESSNEAIQDASETIKIQGPTLVYCRSAMEWQTLNKPDQWIGEWIDEQAGTLMKWSVPVMSVTRSEYFDKVESDMFIFQTPVHLNSTEKQSITGILRSGKAVAIFASPAGGIDPDISELAGISTNDREAVEIKYIGSINGNVNGIFKGQPNTFPLFQPFTINKIKKEIETVYTVSTSPCLIINQTEGKNIIFWSPPEFSKNLLNDPGNYGESLDQLLGSPVPFVLTARTINEALKKNGALSVTQIEQYQPVTISMWQRKDGSFRLLAGNLEEGINHTANKTTKVLLNLPFQGNHTGLKEITELWTGEKLITGDNRVPVYLGQAQTKLYVLK